MNKLLSKVKIEQVMYGFMLLIITITLVVLFCVTPKCGNCGSFVQTAFCTKCGHINENHREPVVENRTGLTCPICNVECVTNYCGDCGSKPIFVEQVDAVTGG